MKSYWLITTAEKVDGELSHHSTYAIDKHPADFLLEWHQFVAGKEFSGRHGMVLLNQVQISAEQFLLWEKVQT